MISWLRSSKELLAVAVIGLAVACAGDGATGTACGETRATAGFGAINFRVTVPEGYQLLAEGAGDNPMLWGSDTDGYSTGAFIVLAEAGEADDSTGLAVVELTGYQGFQGELHQAVDNYPSAPTEDQTIDGQRALVADFGDVTQVVAVRDARRDLAVSAQSNVLDAAALSSLIAETTVVGDEPRTFVPDVEPPDGWVVLGRGSPDYAIALNAFSYDGYTGGPEIARSRAWRSSEGDRVLTVLTLPPSVGDLAAALGFALTNAGGASVESECFQLDDRPAVWRVDESDRATLVTTTDWGELLVVRSAPDGADAPPPNQELLMAVARSVERLD